MLESGNLLSPLKTASADGNQPMQSPQVISAQALTEITNSDSADGNSAEIGRISCHEAQNPGNVSQVPAPPDLEARIKAILDELGGNLLSAPPGRPRAFDDFLRGRLVSLLGIGLSVRQAAGALGLSHTCVQQELKRQPDLLEEVNAARFQAQVEPLLVIIRESRRSWRAATWLVKHLGQKLTGHEETPDEERQRTREEAVEEGQWQREQYDKARKVNRARARQERIEDEEERREARDRMLRDISGMR
jgi:hypothetical protein